MELNQYKVIKLRRFSLIKFRHSDLLVLYFDILNSALNLLTVLYFDFSGSTLNLEPSYIFDHQKL